MATTNQRQVLPTHVKPTHYDLTLTPDLESFTFNGTEIVSLDINEGTNKIEMHVNEIEVHTAKIQQLNLKTSESQEAQITYDHPKEIVIFTFAKELTAGTKAILHLEFSGTLNDKMAGFYRSSYTNQSGEKKYLATTQFESTDARRAFPCWDEPAIKATFDINLIVPSDLTALSNMNAISETPLGNGTKKVKFATTPIMSTYLVAFVVGDLAYVEKSTTGTYNKKPIVIRVYTIKGSEKQGQFALDVATESLEYFAKVFEIPYPLPKLDMIAIPDFEAGAMENWGLVTYRVAAILYDPEASDARFKKRIAYTVSHELAHQWFGNLVTMEWWDHLWLNEGFATWVGYLAVDEIFPDWDIWTQYVTDSLKRGLKLDSLKSSHPIEVPVKNPSEIHQIFDAISYHKGASVIRMLSSFLKVDVFLEGVRKYLDIHKYSNASTDDLWKSLSAVSGINVEEFMAIWVKKTGYPVLTVTEPEDNTIRVSQSRYLSFGEVTEEEDKEIWWVPLGMSAGKSTPAELQAAILTTKQKDFVLPQTGEDFYKLNAYSTGVFRVNYTPKRLEKLGKAIKAGLISDASDRVGLITDAASLAMSGHGKTTGFLNLIKEFENEDKYIVWLELNDSFEELISAWFEQPESVCQGLLSLQRQLFSKLVRDLGWEYKEDEDYLTTLLRTLAIEVAGRSGDPEIVQEAKRRFKLLTESKDKSALHPNVRGAVYETVLTHGGGEKEFEAILEIYRNPQTTADQKVVALKSLGYAQTEELIERTLQLSISPEVKNQDIIHPFYGLQANPKARKPLWNFVKSNWDLLEGRYSKLLNLLSLVIKLSVEDFSSEEMAADVENFFADKSKADFDRPLEQSIENVHVRAAWVKRDAKDVENWLKVNGFM